MKFQRLSLILLPGLMLSNVSRAATVAFLGMQPHDCPAFAQIAADLNAVKFPSDWKIYVVCSYVTWKQVVSRGDATGTNAAFTSRSKKLTVLNGMVHTPGFSLDGYSQKTPQGVLRHELGHITCDSASEDVADRFADKGICK